MSPEPVPELQGTRLSLDTVEPWPDRVDGPSLCVELKSLFTRYLVLPPSAPVALVLFVLHSYLIDKCYVSPVLALVSPLRRCGKTTTVMILDKLVYSGVLLSNVTLASTFRLIARYAPTLILDEADTSFVKSDELRGIFNAGHTRNTAWVMRTVGDDYEPRRFSTWCAKVLALIGRLPSTLEDRSIVVQMKRRGAGETVESLRLDRLDQETEPIKRRVLRWCRDHGAAIAERDPEVPNELNDRAADNWRPLLAIADEMGGDWPTLARSAARALAAQVDRDEQDEIAMLLADVRGVFSRHNARRLKTEDLAAGLISLCERPWVEWMPHQAPRKLANLLRPFKIRSRKMRFGDSTYQGYEKAQFSDAFTRYLSTEVEQPEHTEHAAEVKPDHAIVPDVPDVPVLDEEVETAPTTGR